jgi:hypothetical protein
VPVVGRTAENVGPVAVIDFQLNRSVADFEFLMEHFVYLNNQRRPVIKILL